MFHVLILILIHHLPLQNMNVASAKLLLNKVGEVLLIENPVVEGKILLTFIRGRVKIDMNKPLPAGYWVPREGLPNIWVVYKYERLQSPCFNCGITLVKKTVVSLAMTKSRARTLLLWPLLTLLNLNVALNLV